jgi:PIN domain nuclease of toxin-antitoxin system
MRLLLDTHIIVWIVLNDERLLKKQRELIADSNNELLVSPVVAYKFTDLQQRGRLPMTVPIKVLRDLVGFELTDIPANIWQYVVELPDIHRDPIDRMLIAHALAEGMTLVTADSNIKRYPVSCV